MISSRTNSTVQRYRKVASGEEPETLLLDGPHLIGDALQAAVTVRHALVATNALRRTDIAGLVDLLRARNVEVAEATSQVMAAASPVRTPAGIVALAGRPSGNDGRVFDGSPQVVPLVVVACDIQDPGNLGAIVRVAEAGGATAVVSAGVSADPFGWKALRGSMGSAFRIPLVVAPSTNAIIETARRHGLRIVATDPRNGTTLGASSLSGPTLLLIGSEGLGLSQAVIDLADERITIPMQPPVESLNAAVTAALVVYEARRQRGSDGLTLS